MTRRNLRAPVLLGGIVIALTGTGCTPTIEVRDTSVVPSSTAAPAPPPSWEFSAPAPADQQTALDALVLAVNSYPRDYAGTTVGTAPDGGLAVTVHYVYGVEPRFPVDDFLGAAAAAGIAVTTDRRLFSLAELTDVQTQIAAFEPLAGQVLDTEVDVERNAVVVTVPVISDELGAVVHQRFGSAVVLVAG